MEMEELNCLRHAPLGANVEASRCIHTSKQAQGRKYIAIHTQGPGLAQCARVLTCILLVHGPMQKTAYHESIIRPTVSLRGVGIDDQLG